MELSFEEFCKELKRETNGESKTAEPLLLEFAYRLSKMIDKHTLNDVDTITLAKELENRTKSV